MNHSEPFALSEPSCLKLDCWFQQRNFSWFPTQLVDANKDNFNALFKTQKESCLNWLEIPLIYFVLFCFCVQLPGSLPGLKFAEPYKGIENETVLYYPNWYKTYVWRKFVCFHNTIDFFGQAMLITWFHVIRMKE